MTIESITELSTLLSFSRIFWVWVVSLLTFLFAKPAAMAAEPSFFLRFFLYTMHTPEVRRGMKESNNFVVLVTTLVNSVWRFLFGSAD